jgi:membrane protein implicated in regulation of membrane protease activity
MMVSFIKTFFTILGVIISIIGAAALGTGFLFSVSLLMRGEYQLGALILLSVILISTIAIEVGKKVGGKNEQRS